LKLHYGELLSNFAFNFNLRRYMMVPARHGLLVIGGKGYNGEFQNDMQHVGLF